MIIKTFNLTATDIISVVKSTAANAANTSGENSVISAVTNKPFVEDADLQKKFQMLLEKNSLATEQHIAKAIVVDAPKELHSHIGVFYESVYSIISDIVDFENLLGCTIENVKEYQASVNGKSFTIIARGIFYVLPKLPVTADRELVQEIYHAVSAMAKQKCDFKPELQQQRSEISLLQRTLEELVQEFARISKQRITKKGIVILEKYVELDSQLKDLLKDTMSDVQRLANLDAELPAREAALSNAERRLEQDFKRLQEREGHLNEAIAREGYKQYREHIDNFYTIIQTKAPELWQLLFGESHENRSHDDDL